MKLNTKRTILVGFAFFLICAFWQAYDAVVPLILTNTYHMAQDLSGFIMALDNIFALFMLPFFGALSDKTRTKFGRRTPYIFFGTIAAAVAFPFLGLTRSLTGFILILLFCLLAMATFRSPAVALMPDVTVKRLRSKANAVINLMGTAGGIIILVFGILFKTSTPGKTDFFPYFLAVSGVMLAALAVFMLTVKEPAWAKESKREEDPDPAVSKEGGNEKLTKEELISLLFILASVVLWFMGYNAVTSKYSVYATNYLGVEYNITLIVAQAAAVISYIPVGILASKIGRRKSILIGVAILAVAFGFASLLKPGVSGIFMYVLFALAGIGWATINVNSFPMVVELSKHSAIGKYTGYYYTASMAAQIVTPYLSGVFLEYIGFRTLFPYATVFVVLSFVTMFFVKHGDAKPEMKKDVLEHLDVDA